MAVIERIINEDPLLQRVPDILSAELVDERLKDQARQGLLHLDGQVFY